MSFVVFAGLLMVVVTSVTSMLVGSEDSWERAPAYVPSSKAGKRFKVKEEDNEDNHLCCRRGFKRSANLASGALNSCPARVTPAEREGWSRADERGENEGERACVCSSSESEAARMS